MTILDRILCATGIHGKWNLVEIIRVFGPDDASKPAYHKYVQECQRCGVYRTKRS